MNVANWEPLYNFIQLVANANDNVFIDSIEEITPYHHGIFTNFYEMEDMFVRLVDWSIDDEGVPDSENEFRGRITPNWKIAPFFEKIIHLISIKDIFYF